MKALSQKLSPRELECLAWAAQGKTYTEIGKMLGISFATVKTNLDNARFKLGGVNLAHAVALAILYGHLFMPEAIILARQRNAEEAWEQRQRYFIGEMGVVR
jgi:DNA-binding CsgD family transcriptional regulator